MNDANVNHFEMLALQRRRVDIFERQGRHRTWHTWGAAIILGTCILIGSAWITDALWSYCPEETGVNLILS